MKKIIILFVLLTSSLIYAQNAGITYQAVIYNPSTEILPGVNNTNAILSNKEICLRFSILDATSNLEYQETQRVKTDHFGMVNLIVGLGNQVGGSAFNFNSIVWNSNQKKMKVEIDVKGTCSNFIEVSNQDFSAVPFAYASKVAESVSGIVPIINGGTGSSTVSGAKTNLGLNNVDNTSDANKPISIATQNALNTKEDKSNKSTTTTLGTSDLLYPTQNAVKVYVDTQISNATILDATSNSKGKLKLAGDLGGTADAPTVPGLANKENTITSGTTSQFWRGDKTWQDLTKSTVGLSNVDNTSDANKPISNATQTALNAKEDSSNKSTNITLGTSDVLYPTQNAVKTYVDNQVNSGVIDATSVSKGKLKLAGDLGGTADAPTVPGLANKENTITSGTTSQFWRGDKTWQALTKSTVGLSNVDNTSDINKPISNATQTALNGKEDSSNKSTNGTLGTSDVLYPTQNAVKTYVDGQIAAIIPQDATSTDKGNVQLAGDLAGTNSSATNPVISNAAINTVKIADNAVTNVKIGGVISVEKGGTGADLSSNAGYVKQATTGANFSTVSTIPVADVAGAVSSVNGVTPVNGNVSVLIGNVYTGNTITPTTGTTPIRSDIYIVSGQTGTPNDNGRTFIYDGSVWHEISTNVAALDNTFVKLSGSTMSGNLVFPTTRKITIDDAPTASTDVTNKDYVDTKIGGTGNTNFIPKFSAAKTLTYSSIFDDGTKVGIGTSSPSNTLEINQGTAGNSGLRFTNLNSSSAATTTSSKVLGLDSNGDVVLTNVPGTQNVVSFSTATPTTSGVVFIPNTPSDPSVIYQSTTNNSLWTYDGTNYVTYTAPASTAWNLTGTNNDAGNSKTSSIWRTGGIILGDGVTSSNTFNGYFLARGNMITNPTIFAFENTQTAGTGIFAGNGGGSNFLPNFRMSSSSTFRSIMIGEIQTDSGSDPALQFRSQLQGLGPIVNRPTFTWVNGGVGGTEQMRLTANGRLGINNTAPLGRLIVDDKSYISNLPASSANLLDNTTFRPHTRFQNTVGANNNALSLYSTTAAWGIQSHNYSDGTALPFVLQPTTGFVGVNITNPVSTLANTSTIITGSNTTSAINGGFTWVSSGSGFAGGIYNANPDGNGFLIKNNATGVTNNVLEVATGTQSTTINSLLNVKGNGNVGIGTNSPISKFEVNGSATNTAAYNNGGSATAIAFSMSNLAYTTLSPQLFALTGIKDGGTYTLAVQGPTQGTSTFMAPGFTFRYVNNGPSIANTHTLYTFIVMGTTVYVYTTIGFTP